MHFTIPDSRLSAYSHLHLQPDPPLTTRSRTEGELALQRGVVTRCTRKSQAKSEIRAYGGGKHAKPIPSALNGRTPISPLAATWRVPSTTDRYHEFPSPTFQP